VFLNNIKDSKKHALDSQKWLWVRTDKLMFYMLAIHLFLHYNFFYDFSFLLLIKLSGLGFVCVTQLLKKVTSFTHFLSRDIALFTVSQWYCLP